MNRLSIRWRITLWNTVAFAVVLAGFGVLVYRLLRKIHYDHVDRGLQARHLELDKAIELGREPVAAAVGWVGRLEKRGYVDGMVRNLIDNAIKYSDRGDRIDVRLRRSGDEAIVEVRDTGIGIPPEHPTPRVRSVLSRRARRFAARRRRARVEHRPRRGRRVGRPDRSRERGGQGDGVPDRASDHDSTVVSFSPSAFAIASTLESFASSPSSMARTVPLLGIPARLATAYQVSPCALRASCNVRPIPEVPPSIVRRLGGYSCCTRSRAIWCGWRSLADSFAVTRVNFFAIARVLGFCDFVCRHRIDGPLVATRIRRSTCDVWVSLFDAEQIPCCRSK